jgi:hypothetical protein
VQNCAVLRASPNGSGRFRLSASMFVGHIPVNLRTELDKTIHALTTAGLYGCISGANKTV